jgi:broad specificity phosphatase PhoE
MSTPISRTLYLIRHAESYENEMMHRVRSKDWSLDLLNLLYVPGLIDCPLSDKGVAQVANLKEFTSEYNVAGTKGFLQTLAKPGQCKCDTSVTQV